MGPTTINRKYRGRILRLLRKIRDHLIGLGYTVDEPWDMTADEFWYAMLVRQDSKGDEPAKEGDVDISIKICEAESYGDDKYGVNFALDIVEVGGRILGGLTPYNYTDSCWVDRRDPDAVEARFSILEDSDISDIPGLIGEPKQKPQPKRKAKLDFALRTV